MNDLTRPSRRPSSDAEVPLDHWAALVREARRVRRLSQSVLAAAAGVTQQTISKIEVGDICPHDRLKLRLAVALDVPPAALFPWPEQQGIMSPLAVGATRG